MWYNRGMEFYSYLWLREDGTPYYAGKGSGRRAYRGHRHRGLQPPRDVSLILVFSHSSEAEAFESEKAFIRWFGRKDSGTGCLINHTDGGDQPPSAKGRKRSVEFVQQMRERAPTIQTPESKEKNRLAHLGRRHTTESKTRQSEKMKGRLKSAETKAKMSLAQTGNTKWVGRHHTAATKAKMSATRIARYGRRAHEQNNQTR